MITLNYPSLNIAKLYTKILKGDILKRILYIKIIEVLDHLPKLKKIVLIMIINGRYQLPPATTLIDSEAL